MVERPQQTGRRRVVTFEHEGIDLVDDFLIGQTFIFVVTDGEEDVDEVLGNTADTM